MLSNNTIGVEDERVKYLISKDKKLGEYIQHKKNIDYHLFDDINRFFVFTIIGQLIPTKVANKIYENLKQICNNDFTQTNILKFSKEDLRKCGMTYKKAEYILSFMELLDKKPNYFKDILKLDTKDALKELIKLRGVGKWTAKMVLIFCFDAQDLVPVEDFAFIKGFNGLYGTNYKPVEVEKVCKKWSPYMSIGARFIYAYADEMFSNIPKV